ncbi:alpha-amylase 3, chloroplastic-like protein [Tanacetum coccineum]
MFSRYKPEISALISQRNRNKRYIMQAYRKYHKVKITKVKKDVNASIIDDKVAMKIGSGHYESQSGSQKLSLAV